MKKLLLLLILLCGSCVRDRDNNHVIFDYPQENPNLMQSLWQFQKSAVAEVGTQARKSPSGILIWDNRWTIINEFID